MESLLRTDEVPACYCLAYARCQHSHLYPVLGSHCYQVDLIAEIVNTLHHTDGYQYAFVRPASYGEVSRIEIYSNDTIVGGVYAYTLAQRANSR